MLSGTSQTRFGAYVCPSLRRDLYRVLRRTISRASAPRRHSANGLVAGLLRSSEWLSCEHANADRIRLSDYPCLWRVCPCETTAAVCTRDRTGVVPRRKLACAGSAVRFHHRSGSRGRSRGDLRHRHLLLRRARCGRGAELHDFRDGAEATVRDRLGLSRLGGRGARRCQTRPHRVLPVRPSMSAADRQHRGDRHASGALSRHRRERRSKRWWRRVDSSHVPADYETSEPSGSLSTPLRVREGR